MPILDIQKRARELGRIRIGQVVATANGKTRPEKLDRFRLTAHSKPLLEKVAALYGGEVREWTPQGGGAKAWEVVTTSNRLPIMVPPQPVTQWYEYWTAGGCKHRCDGHTNVLTDEICDPESFEHKEALDRPTTRLNVVLRDVEGIGVWRLETHGWNAAVELPDAAEFLAQAGGYVNGWVSLEPRTSKAEVPDRQNGATKIQTRHFHVPIIEIDVTPTELMAGRGRVQAPQLEGPVPQQAAALPAGTDAYTPYFARLEAVTTFEECQQLWADALAAELIGPKSTPSQRAAEFFEAIKAKGQSYGTATQKPAPAPEPDADGAYPVEVVEDPESAAAAADMAWQRLVQVAGDKDLGLSDLTATFVEDVGVAPNKATAAQIDAFAHFLSTGEQVPA